MEIISYLSARKKQHVFANGKKKQPKQRITLLP